MGKNGFFTVDELESTKFDVMDFQGRWKESLGRPEKAGVWIIYGDSFNGKTFFTIELVKYLTQFVKHKIIINSLEEGKTESMKLTSINANLRSVKDKILFGDRVPISVIRERLKKQRSPEIIVIDSIQYTGLKIKEYEELVNEFRNKLFIFLSHVDGKLPRGSLAKYVRYDSMIKIYVEGYKAFVKSRFGGGKPFIIHPEKAAIYHGDIT